MKYIIIGLGNYGHVLAEELANLGHEVIGADINAEKVDAIKDKIATAFAMDATDISALSVLPLKNVDVVMVTIGEDLGASVRVVALLKKLEIKHIYARAIDDIHKAILAVFNLELILTPEEDAARQLVQLLNYGTEVKSFPVDKDHYVMKIRVTDKIAGKYVDDLHLETEFNLNLIALTRRTGNINIIGISAMENEVIRPNGNERVQAGDELVCYGRYRNFQLFLKGL